jgi:hypothetical protein
MLARATAALRKLRIRVGGKGRRDQQDAKQDQHENAYGAPHRFPDCISERLSPPNVLLRLAGTHEHKTSRAALCFAHVRDSNGFVLALDRRGFPGHRLLLRGKAALRRGRFLWRLSRQKTRHNPLEV